MRRLIWLLAAALTALGHTAARAALPTTGVAGDGADDGIVTLVYNPADGNLFVDTAGKEFTALVIESASRRFDMQPLPPPCHNALIDACSPRKLFVLRPVEQRFLDLDFGPALPPGLSKEELSADLTVSGALFPQGPPGQVDLHFVPEPTSVSLLSLSLLGWFRWRGHRRN